MQHRLLCTFALLSVVFSGVRRAHRLSIRSAGCNACAATTLLCAQVMFTDKRLVIVTKKFMFFCIKEEYETSIMYRCASP